MWALEVPGAARDVLLYVPDGLGDRPARLVVSLHGAGGEAGSAIARFRPWADSRRLLVLAPTSCGPTWDVIVGGWGPDVLVLDAALDEVFAMFSVPPEDVVVSGFSDGASYALSLAVANGDVFPRVLAFSPGFCASAPAVGRSEVFVSHGVSDNVLPIDRTTRLLVPRLRSAGHRVQVREFSGSHTVPPEIVEAGLDWLGWPRFRED